MKFSAFTPIGLFRLKRGPSLARVIYDAKVSALGAVAGKLPAYASVEPGTRLHAKVFAESIRDGVIRMLIQRAAQCDIPSKLHPDMIPIREQEFGISPPLGALLHQRRHAIEAAARLPLGGSRFNIETTLRRLLGAGFVYYRTFDPSADARVLYPANIGDSPMSLKRAAAGRVIVTADAVPSPDGPIPGISMPSTIPQVVYYSARIPKPLDGSHTLFGGEELVIEPDNAARCERVTVTEVGTDSAGHWFKAAFLSAHEPGSFCTTGGFPFWATNQRYAHIVVTPAVAADPNLVRQIHVLMRNLARGVSTWAVVESSSTTTSGPFKVQQSALGFVPLGTITFPFLPPAGP